MIYFILPPIVIVFGITIIVIILSKKSDDVEKLKIRDKNKTASLGGTQNMMKRAGNIFSSFGLKILERLIQRSKILSLRFHNLSSRWFQYIKSKKEKKEKSAESIQFIQPDNLESDWGKDQIVETPAEKPKRQEKKISFSFIEEVKEVEKRAPIIEEEAIEPMVSRHVIHPDSNSVAKSKFEEILIERIASNPRDIEAYERLGEYYMERNAYEDSRECFNQVIKLSPGHYKAKLKLRRLEKMIHD
jgi:hypothetical protein